MANWHRVRKFVHLACFLLFLALPFLNVVRFDIPHQRFYFAGQELWISEFVIIFFTLMFLLFVVVAFSVFYGRVYCGYLCPQMIFSEASVLAQNRIRRWCAKRGYSKTAASAAFYAALAPASVFLAFVFISYFVEPRDLFHRLISLDVRTAGGISGASVTILTFLDFAFLRQRFCTAACPYGYLQGMLGDGHTLLVHYRDESHACIECKKCVRVCPMEIDIRESPFQIECIHCAECIDACGEIMARLKKPNLIHYVWGEKGPVVGQALSPANIDAKRVVVLLVLLAYASGLTYALATRHPLLVRVSPVRATLYRIGANGRIYNRFHYSLANRSGKPAAVAFSARDLPGAAVSAGPVALAPGESAAGEFEISIPAGPRAGMVTHFTIAAGEESIPMTFLAPPEKP
jgi:cytochrome c oxidase accessory protein FixG